MTSLFLATARREYAKILMVAVTVGLGLAVFLYPLHKPIPPGVDAAVYLNDAHWIVEHHALPKSGQITYHGSTAYPAPLTALNLAVISQLTGWPLAYPTFSVYQALLIVLLLLSCYLVGTIYGRTMAILFPVAALGSHALIRLFIGSTVANILAFIIINCLFYLTHDYVKRKRQVSLILIAIFLVGLYFAHSYLTAPLFIPIYFLYFILVIATNHSLRQGCIAAIQRWPRWLKVGVPLILVGSIAAFVIYYIPVFREARYSFWLNQPASKFAGVIPASLYQTYLGNFIFIPGVLGLCVYAFRPKKNLLSYRVLPWLWIIVLLGLLQLYHLGIHFFYERIVFLGGIFLSFFAAYFITWAFAGRGRGLAITGISFFIILTIVSGSVYAKDLYDKSNLATSDQIQALRILHDISKPEDQVYSHINGVSETYHDVMVSDRDIVYLKTKAVNCVPNDARCLAFTTPEAESSYTYFRTGGAKYYLFLKPSQEGNAALDELISRYAANRHYRALFRSDRAALFTLGGQ